MDKASPRPWKQLKTDLGHPFNAKGMIIDDANGHYVCRLFHPDSPVAGTTSNCGTRTECEDNAALIVRSVNAAEDLATSLQEILADMEFHTGGDLSGWTDLGRARIERARAALSKWEATDA